jgi:SAM-dependent methyltransferase
MAKEELARAAGEQAALALKDKHPALEGYFPHAPGSPCYLIPKTPAKGPIYPDSPFPVPPTEVRVGYGTTDQQFLDSGKKDVQTIRDILARAGTSVEAASRILDFGCASGRMVRWFLDVSDRCEVWGTDISASCIHWCKQHLSPPFHFATTTVYPHLPFEDHYFGLIYSGSVFTHIDDLADAWFLELRRILRPGGKLYVSIHDRHTAKVLEGKNWFLPNFLCSFPEYKQYLASDFGMFTMGRSVSSQVFYDPEFLARRLAPFYRVLSVTEEAYYHQTVMLLERV